MWSEKQLGTSAGAANNVGLAPDGKRIVALMPVETAEAQKAQNHLIFLENFFDEVRRRTATQSSNLNDRPNHLALSHHLAARWRWHGVVYLGRDTQ